MIYVEHTLLCWEDHQPGPVALMARGLTVREQITSKNAIAFWVSFASHPLKGMGLAKSFLQRKTNPNQTADRAEKSQNFPHKCTTTMLPKTRMEWTGTPFYKVRYSEIVILTGVISRNILTNEHVCLFIRHNCLSYQNRYVMPKRPFSVSMLVTIFVSVNRFCCGQDG